MPDSAFQLAGRQLFRADRNRLSRKARGGGLCVYINKGDVFFSVYKAKVNVCYWGETSLPPPLQASPRVVPQGQGVHLLVPLRLYF
ncbi:hypothetical protein SRHO_G00072120 [Serrasalmus rhombeus]